MRRKTGPSRRIFLLPLALIVTALAFAAVARDTRAQDVSSIGLVAIDAITDGNDATTLGPLDGCVQADAESEVSVDVVLDAVPEDRPAIAFQMDILYDPDILEVTAVDHELFLAAEGTYQPVAGLTDPLPDRDGSFTVAVLDAASNIETDENMESGAGALVRVTFGTLAAGTSDVAIGFEGNEVYPAILSIDNEPTQVDSIGAALVSVGEPCPADAEPTITQLPPLEDLVPTPGPTIDPSTIPDAEGGGIDYALLAGAVAVGVLGIGAAVGGWLLYRRSSRS